MKDAAPDEAAILAEIYAEIDAIHASYATNPPTPRLIYIQPGASEADRICLTCRGVGQLTDTHAYGDATVCRCHRCDGKGIRA